MAIRQRQLKVVSDDEKKAHELLEAYRITFNSPHGQIVLEDLKRTFHDHIARNLGPQELAWEDGTRTVYMSILNLKEKGEANARGEIDLRVLVNPNAFDSGDDEAE